ncbi:hypothetical protein GIB67_021562, partial [Kingdonia uniflora]
AKQCLKITNYAQVVRTASKLVRTTLRLIGLKPYKVDNSFERHDNSFERKCVYRPNSREQLVRTA